VSHYGVLFFFSNAKHGSLSTYCSNKGSKLIVDYTMEFPTYEIFQSREALLNWARDVGKTHGFFIIIKKSDTTRDGVKGRVILSCERSGIGE